MITRLTQDVDVATVEVWARRAAELARVPAPDDEGERASLVVMRIGREKYGFDARHVFDIRPAGPVARVPRAPAWVAGVTVVGGRILSVLDLATYWGLPPGEEEAEWGRQHMVLVETADMELCLLVDEVMAVVSLAMGRLRKAGENLQGLPPEHVRGVVMGSAMDTVPWGDGMLVVLDLPALLGDRRIVVNQEVS